MDSYWYTVDGQLLPKSISVFSSDGINGKAEFVRQCDICGGLGYLKIHVQCPKCIGSGLGKKKWEDVLRNDLYLARNNYTYPFTKSPDLIKWKEVNSSLVTFIKQKSSKNKFLFTLNQQLEDQKFLSEKQIEVAYKILGPENRFVNGTAIKHILNAHSRISCILDVIDCEQRVSPVNRMAYYSFVCKDKESRCYILYSSCSKQYLVGAKYAVTGVIRKIKEIKMIEYAFLGVITYNHMS